MVSDACKYVFPLVTLAIVFALFNLFYMTFIFVLLALFVCYFFRNPARVIPSGENLIVSPADGKVVKISRLSGGDQIISIFLNIFDVHVNRSPIAGKLERLEYKHGKFLAAFDEQASRVNEQNVITIRGEGIQVIVRQIAGLVARRVVCWKRPGHKIERGELFGLIRFGSRVDVILPEDVDIFVKTGDRVRGGSSVLGKHT